MKTRQFDINDSPLKGANLIEASAGTGKTYTITGIFLRLIIEKSLNIEQILVVTFTNAATNELKDRIRKKLGRALALFSSGNMENQDDIFLRGLFLKNKDKKKKITQKLKQAIRDFDQASVFTIHGFCQRMLGEYAFESKTQFDARLFSDEDKLKKEVIEDFWRINFYNEAPVFARYAKSVISPGKFFRIGAGRALSPEIKIIPEISTHKSAHIEKDFIKYGEKLKKIWDSQKHEICRILLTHKSLNRNKYRKNTVLDLTARMNEYFNYSPHVNLFDGFIKFTDTYIKSAVKKNKTPPRHDFFVECENFYNTANDLKTIFDKKILKLKFVLFEYLKKELKAKKQALNVKSFDDLIIDFYEALKDEKTGNKLAGAIRARYKAALIDEFQDTDPLQYEIFKKIFMGKNSILFLIGDPKQAIYGFRGADIFAYMDASSHISQKYTLSTNWRSHKKLVRAVNTVFDNNPAPFLYEKIGFEPVRPASSENTAYEDMAGLTIWLDSSSKAKDGKEKAINKKKAQNAVIKSMVYEISRLADNNVKPGDIAVLVRKNSQAEMVRQALSSVNIPAVICNAGHVFETWEATEMIILLSAILNPGDEKGVSTALATYMGGFSGNELANLKTDENNWEKILGDFFEYRSIWQSRGFFRMFREFMKKNHLIPRIMSLPFGQRRATNILHLAELVHQAEMEKGIRMSALVKWLCEQKNAGEEHPQEHLIRLETDDDAVQILTMHKSKGLEFPIVFCPFTWDGSKTNKNRDPVFFHDANENPVIDLGSENIDKNRKIAEKELLAENIRLFYVGLTRAKAVSYLAWGKINKAGTSAPAYIFHNQSAKDDISAMEKEFAKISTDFIVNDIKNLAAKSQGAINVSDLPVDKTPFVRKPDYENTKKLSCRKFQANMEKNFEIASYSSLVSGSHRKSAWDEWEFGEYAPLENRENEDPDIFSFPKGPGPGTCLHEIFENISFTNPNSSRNMAVVGKTLEKYAISSGVWQKTIFNMVIKTLSAPLDGSDGKFSLSAIKKEARIHEMNFYFPVENILSSEKLENIFGFFGCDFDFQAFKGFMTGFMDLVFTINGKFYIIDWKSNHLGNSQKDYSYEKLYDAIKKSSYFLQYHIYTLALHKYLALKIADYDYEKHFAGVFYLFLRGIDPEKNPEYGIFKDRPSKKIINALDRILQAKTSQ